jgi:ribosomal peptide maturation radical SAM protein 1
MSRVLIVNMPFASLRWPNLGPSLLQAGLKRRGIGCDLAYLNFDFAERIGRDDYAWIAEGFGFVLGGERLFARDYFGDALPGDAKYRREVLLAADPGLSERELADFEALQRHTGPFLDACTRSIDWSRYSVVGFTLSFQQTMASMGLARRIKRLRPEVRIALGGAACQGVMGVELLRRFPEVDYVFRGEADLTFPAVVEQVLAGGPVQVPPGAITREATEGSVSLEPPLGSASQLPSWGRFSTCQGRTACCPTRRRDAERAADEDATSPLIARLDDLPYPDFDDYFARLRASPLAAAIEPLLFFETSRGCWWGQKHHCAFCGLNGASLDFRSKEPDRAIAELKHLVERYGVRRVCTADNILDHRYFDTFWPRLAAAGLDAGLIFEMKTNLTRQQVQILLDGGLEAAQLGIESFLTPVLRQVGKGATALQNLQTLKWFSEAGIEVKWNVLYGFPGEDPALYGGFAAMVPSLVHLAPPAAVARVRLDRYSPYFADPAAFGITDPRPHRAFRFVYPFPPDALGRIAYYFEYDYADGRTLDYADPLVREIHEWQRLAGSATLTVRDLPDGVLLLQDTRPVARTFQQRLVGPEREIYLFCDTGRSLEAISEFAESRGLGLSRPAIRRLLEEWIAERWAIFLDERYLSLAGLCDRCGVRW